MTIRPAAIADLVEPVKSWNPASVPHSEFLYIDLSAIDQGEKVITSAIQVRGVDAPTRARQLVRSGDVLVSTVRPNLNGVAPVLAEWDGATASPGFCVLRPRTDRLEARYLMHWVRSPVFIERMVGEATGASYPAVSDRIVKASQIPLPSLEEQRQIAEILDKADALRRKRKLVLNLLDGLSEAIFKESFVCGNTGWPVRTVNSVARDIRTGPFGSQLLHSEFTERGVAVLGIDNAVTNEFRWGGRRYISLEKYHELKRYTVAPGDVLITIMGTCGRCAIVPDIIETAINTKHLCCITLDQQECIPEFLHAALLRHPAILQQLGVQAKGAVMPGLNMGIIKALELALPPMDHQRTFALQMRAISEVRKNSQRAMLAAENLFTSLQHRAFSGQL